ncbi:beta-1,3-glucanase family protein [Parachryseolinea silvisoli]|uniref:beta-1,3-glucanase family protein n=1 Tax=Parachryseolinea silvisoli TaxID=2873601 RepID=UPI002265A547|nr:beta-1,3-glucanase family protein [Parachryseolinea silvisoli]MCD9018512.1 carbohydrate-binding protein [Parachryseolinea silvisoli]
MNTLLHRRWNFRLPAIIAITFILYAQQAWSQAAIPFTLNNRSAYADANVYVAVVGIINDNHVWIDTRTGAVRTMSTADNTVQGPVNNGDQGPGGNGKYANCFARLSEIPNKTIQVPGIVGCRILIAFNSQLYLYFFGATGGYAAPNLANPNDPNQGVRYEIIELANATNGLWANTTRVDAYQYPMGLEVWGNNGFYKKVGELKTHADILAQWQSTAPAAFASCLDATKGIIHCPSKTPAFAPGGAQGNYLGGYIDAIWSKYTSGDLVFNGGDVGTWRGRVSGQTFTFTRSSDGAIATITRKPTTIEALEGSGSLAAGSGLDKAVQTQICAAINRHAINLNLATGATQDFSPASGYYGTSPYNWYSKFWHGTDISHEGFSYGFCYDDAFDRSSTINASSPIRATVTIGGFAGTTGGGFSTVIQAESWAYMAGVQTEATTDAGGGLNVGWIDAGDWLAYNITIPQAGTYRITYRVASPNSNTTLKLEKDAGATQLGTVTVPNTGGWQNWANVSHDVTLPAGTYSVGIATTTGGFNLNYITVASTAAVSARSQAENKTAATVTLREENAVVLSPNPVRDLLSIHHAETVKRVSIYAVDGQKIMAVENPGSAISVQQLKPGIHIVVVEHHDLTIRKEKIIKE